MAQIKLTQTITHILSMKKVRLSNHQSVKWFFDSIDDTLQLASYAEDIDFVKQDYWTLYDERKQQRWLVEFRKGLFRANPQQVSKSLLQQYQEWGDLIFNEWTGSFGGRVIPLTIDALTIHEKPPEPDTDRVYLWIREGSVRMVRYGVKKHKRFIKSKG